MKLTKASNILMCVVYTGKPMSLVDMDLDNRDYPEHNVA